MNAAHEGAVIVRASTAADVARVTEIYAYHVRTGLASFEIVPPDAAEMAHRREEVVARGLPFLVAEAHGHVVGFAYATPYRLRAAYRHTLEDSVYVDRDESGRGIGRALLGRVLADCAGHGYRQMIAVIGDSRNSGSIALHEACGFVRVGLLPAVGYKLGRWVDSVLMQRALGAGANAPPTIGG